MSTKRPAASARRFLFLVAVLTAAILASAGAGEEAAPAPEPTAEASPPAAPAVDPERVAKAAAAAQAEAEAREEAERRERRAEEKREQLAEAELFITTADDILILAGMHIYQEATGKTMVSVLAGLGIGGLALALASQQTLQNLLGFASIAFDKAFLVGDAVNIADYEGTVEHVGLRSMRLRTYDGRSVVIPNNNAINSNIVNLNRRPYIRREVRVYLSPLNPYEKVEEAVRLIREAVEGHDGKAPGLEPTVRFADFEPARFVIQALFWYDADKQPHYLDECSRINLEVARRQSEAGVLHAER